MSKLNRFIYSLHSWLGLIAGLFILTFFLTGSIIVFRKELNEWQYPQLHQVLPQEKSFLSFSKLYQRARQQQPGLYLYSFRGVPRNKTETVEMRVYNPVKKEYGLLYMDPYNGKVLGTTWRNSLYDILLKLHYSFFLGRLGELLAAIFALALLGSLITGLIVYRKYLIRMLTLRTKMSWHNWRTTSSSFHRIIGVWTTLFNLVLAVSGFYMMMYTLDLKAHFGKDASSSLAHPPAVEQDLDIMIRKAEFMLQGAFLYMDLPRETGEPISIYTDGAFWLWGDFVNKVEFDPASGAVRRLFRQTDMTTGEKIEYALYTLHFGQYGGKTIKLLYCFFGIAGSMLSITGFILWYRKKRTRQQHHPRGLSPAGP